MRKSPDGGLDRRRCRRPEGESFALEGPSPAVAGAGGDSRRGRGFLLREGARGERLACPPVTRLSALSRTRLAALGCVAAAAVLAGCGQGKIEVPKRETALRQGAVLFNQRCSGCHSLGAANARGSTPPGKLKAVERTDGPNFNVRHESKDDVLFAIRNGGFSGAIMPANVVVGRNAELVAEFLAKYSGKKKK
jgi:mono/diheme cytochrome c family protein